MAEEGGLSSALESGNDLSSHQDGPMPIQMMSESRKSTWSKGADVHVSGRQTPMMSRHNSIDLGDYFVGPRDMDAHSKLPFFLRVHGSVLPRMILPLTMITLWATLITCLHILVTPLGVATILLTVLGFVVGLALSFRSSTAYERYSEGRKAWATLAVHSKNLARYVWVHVEERAGHTEEDLLAKVTAINLILAFSVALKHRLRFEPFAHYEDLSSLVGHLDTFAKAAHKEENLEKPKKTPWKRAGESMGVSFAQSNPRKAIKRADRPLGNLPMEIITYLSSYFESIMVQNASTNGTLRSPIIYGQIMTCLAAMNDVQANAERVLDTPLPIGYNILISQIVLLYVYLLPFQLVIQLGWITIPATLAAAYIILGLAAIGNELENPFGDDVNDLPLNHFCDELASELDTLMSSKASSFYQQILKCADNKPLWPLSEGDAGAWEKRGEKEIRSALRAKVLVGSGARMSTSSERTAEGSPAPGVANVAA